MNQQQFSDRWYLSPGDGSLLGAGALYAALRQRVVEAGLFAPRPRYYLGKSAVTGLALCAALAVAILTGRIHVLGWILAATLFAVMAGQVGQLAHDLLHQQILRDPRRARLVGILVNNVLIGTSAGWWQSKHNRHHRQPNRLGVDEDIDFPILALAPDLARRSSAVGRWLVGHQAMLFPLSFPFVSLAFLVNSLIYAGRGLVGGHRDGPTIAALEAVGLVLHVVLIGALALLAFDGWAALWFVLLQRGLLGVYGVAMFAPNHFGMPLVRAGQDADFVTHQVETARNIRSNGWVAFWFGGLEFQIEHHLFPTMPRPNLAKAAPIVREFCAAHAIRYRETSALGAYRDIFRALSQVSRLEQSRAAGQ